MESENPQAMCPLEDRPAAVPLDGQRMERVIRHRLRNFCAGMKMALSAFDERPGLLPGERERCSLMKAEVDDLQRLSDRLALAFGALPLLESRSVATLMGGLQEDFRRTFPCCTLETDGVLSQQPLPGGSWLEIVFRELLRNAGEAAGRAGTVRLYWRLEPAFAAGVATVGVQWPPDVPDNPFLPFVTTRSRHEGLGLSIAQRLCHQLQLRFARAAATSGAVVFLIADARENGHG